MVRWVSHLDPRFDPDRGRRDYAERSGVQDLHVGRPALPPRQLATVELHVDARFFSPAFQNLVETYYLYTFNAYVGGTINQGPPKFGGGGGAGPYLPGRSVATGAVGDYLEDKFAPKDFWSFRDRLHERPERPGAPASRRRTAACRPSASRIRCHPVANDPAGDSLREGVPRGHHAVRQRYESDSDVVRDGLHPRLLTAAARESEAACDKQSSSCPRTRTAGCFSRRSASSQSSHTPPSRLRKRRRRRRAQRPPLPHRRCRRWRRIPARHC